MKANRSVSDVRTGVLLVTRTILVCLLPGAMAGCGGGSGGVGNPNPFEASNELVRIEVLNRDFAQATVRAIYTGTRRTLGRVSGHSSATFSLEWPFARPLRFEIGLLAGQNCVTRELNVQPGEVLELQIEPGLSGREGCWFR